MKRLINNPEYQARLDWASLGEFNTNKYQGKDKERYKAEQSKIIQEWDTRHEYC